MDEATEYALLLEAMKLEDLFFQDMTLNEFPKILEVLDEWGWRHNPTIEHVRFTNLESEPDGDTFGEYDRRTKTISIAPEHAASDLCHEMIHHYENELDELSESLRQYLAIKLWQRMYLTIPDLEDRVQAHLEVVGHRDLENVGGQHDVLFLLKSYDIDIQLGLPLGTTFGYGYDSQAY